MNRSIKNIFTCRDVQNRRNLTFRVVSLARRAAIVIVLMISLAITTMSRACHAIPCGTCKLMTSETIYDENEPNEPEPMPEMVPGCVWSDVLNEDPNEEPAEMIPGCVWSNISSEDPNDEPAEMIPNI